MPDEPTMTAPSDYNRVLQESIRRKDQVRQLRAENENLKADLQAIIAERDEFADALVSLGDSHEQLESQLNAAPDELQARINELEKEILTRDRTQEFNKLAKEKGIKDEHFEDAIKLLGWKPDGDDHDPAKLGESIDGLVGRFPLFKGEATPAVPAAGASQGGAQQTPRVAPRPPGPGAFRGGLPTVSARDTDAELAKKYPDASRLA
jgi:hypothetical protein